jgi:DNA-binding NtrC family response regulator
MTISWDKLLHNNYSSVEQMLSDMHHRENLTEDEMATKLGVSLSSLRRKVKELGIKMKKPGGAPFSKNKGGKNHGRKNHC